VVFTSIGSVRRSSIEAGRKFLALLSPPVAGPEPWTNDGDKPDSVLNGLIVRALEKENLVEELKSSEEFENSETRAIRVRECLDGNAIIATGTDEEHVYRRRVAEIDLWPMSILLGWLIFAEIGAYITARGLYRVGFSVGTDSAWGYCLAVIGSISIAVLFVMGMRRNSSRAATLLLCVGVIGASSVYTAYYESKSIWPEVAGGVTVSAIFYAIALFAMRRREWLKDRLRVAFERWKATLYAHGLVPSLATLTNDILKKRYSIQLNYSAEFLSRSSASEELHQSTPVGLQLAEFMGTLKDGSLAVAGPRGAGKSDLMAAFCRGSYNPRSERLDLVVSVSAPVVYLAADFMLNLHIELCDAVVSYVYARDPSAATRVGRQRRRVVRTLRFGRKPRVLKGWAEVLQRASEHADNIRYLLTIGGEFSLRIGIRRGHLSSKRTLSKAEQPKTYPQIVNSLRKDLEYFANRVVTLGGTEGSYSPRLIVAVDELDRIHSPEQALQFINEIKAIFRVPNCYFLMSVSEDALEEFELAAMGARTAIDSAFDEVLRVDYMDFALSKKLLGKYVVGLPEQFLALVYVRSGGLARQLIRCVRELINWRREDMSLSAVVGSLAASDLRRISTAAKGSLIKVSNRRAIADLVRALDDYPTSSPIDQIALIDHANRLIRCDIGDDEDACSLRDILTAQTLYLATLVSIFSSALDEEGVKKATDPAKSAASFEALARVRRYLTVNPQAALELLVDFREHWNMGEFDHGLLS
jgi:hypothetical protein